MAFHRSPTVVLRDPATGPSSAIGRLFFIRTNRSPACLILARQSPRFRAALVLDSFIFMRKSDIM